MSSDSLTFRVRLLAFTFDVSSMHDLLQAPRHGCVSALARAKDAASRGEKEWAQALHEEAGERCEGFLGLGFVIGQFAINDICQNTSRLVEAARTQFKSFPDVGGGKALMTVGAAPFDGSPYSTIQIINAAANYWKHKAEFLKTWKQYEQEKTQAARTILQVKSAGAEEYATHNLDTIAQSLGMKSVQDAWAFIAEPIATWHGALVSRLDRELAAVGHHDDS